VKSRSGIKKLFKKQKQKHMNPEEYFNSSTEPEGATLSKMTKAKEGGAKAVENPGPGVVTEAVLNLDREVKAARDSHYSAPTE
jgi:hypothetical protein